MRARRRGSFGPRTAKGTSMDDKNTILILIAVVLLAIAGWRCVLMARRGGVSSTKRTYTYKCGACGAEFEMDEETLRSHDRAGRVKTPPNEYKRYPCAQCDEIAAWLNEVLE